MAAVVIEIEKDPRYFPNRQFYKIKTVLWQQNKGQNKSIKTYKTQVNIIAKKQAHKTKSKNQSIKWVP